MTILVVQYICMHTYGKWALGLFLRIKLLDTYTLA